MRLDALRELDYTPGPWENILDHVQGEILIQHDTLLSYLATL